MLSLKEAIAAYETALEYVADQSGDPLRVALMSVLVARDGVASALTHDRPMDAQGLARVMELDSRLKARAPALVAQVGPAALADWREAVQPPANAWWWYLDGRATSSPGSHVFWSILSGLFLTLSLSLTAEISRRFLSVGSDFIGVFSTMSQALLAFLAGSTLTQAGRDEVERLLLRRGIPQRVHHYWKTGLALAVLLIILALRLSLPAIARFYNDQGVHLHMAGLITRAITSYQRAISLNPDYAQAHYNLATAYEDILEYDKALVEYQTAIRADPQLYLAYNNLARLYILRRNDFASALTLLSAALNLDALQQPYVQYSLLKNRGWAHLGLRLYGLAEHDLREALTRREDGAAAHCLLAQVLESKGETESAPAEWEACLRYAPGDVVETSWLSLAQERLSH